MGTASTGSQASLAGAPARVCGSAPGPTTDAASGHSARPRVVYLIGGMGSGKSSVAARLRARGVPVYDLDEAGHEALRLPAVKGALRAAFGDGVLGADGEVARPTLARAAFATPEATEMLNRITTRAIVDLMEAWLRRQRTAGERRCVVEVSAYDGPDGRFPAPDEVLAVVAPLKTRVARAVAKGFSEADVRARISRQATDEERREWADVVIENDGSLAALERAVDAWWDAHCGR